MWIFLILITVMQKKLLQKLNNPHPINVILLIIYFYFILLQISDFILVLSFSTFAFFN